MFNSNECIYTGYLFYCITFNSYQILDMFFYLKMWSELFIKMQDWHIPVYLIKSSLPTALYMYIFSTCHVYQPFKRKMRYLTNADNAQNSHIYSFVQFFLSLQLMVPRISYFPLHTEKINKHFLKYASEKETEEMWLEHDNQPLKWFTICFN